MADMKAQFQCLQRGCSLQWFRQPACEEHGHGELRVWVHSSKKGQKGAELVKPDGMGREEWLAMQSVAIVADHEMWDVT